MLQAYQPLVLRDFDIYCGLVTKKSTGTSLLVVLLIVVSCGIVVMLDYITSRLEMDMDVYRSFVRRLEVIYSSV